MRVHEERKKGELTAEQISDIWVDTQKQYFGPSVKTDEYDRYYWMVVPHFYDSPFYVYSYSFAQMLVSGLYQVAKTSEKEGQAAKEEFVENYIGLLETGITRNFYEMFQPFGLDPETPEFWQHGLSLIDKYLTELEKLDGQPNLKAVPQSKPKSPKP
jgi:oligoendopeptidase F